MVSLGPFSRKDVQKKRNLSLLSCDQVCRSKEVGGESIKNIKLRDRFGSKVNLMNDQIIQPKMDENVDS